jgi:glycosyltransferase involved in cell wall biosynthesis
VPKLTYSGGVATYYMALKHFWREEIKYNIIGRRWKKIPIEGLFWLPWDTLKFVFWLLFFSPELVVLNPSMGRTAIIRDSCFFRIALFFRKKTVVFFHGWDKDFVKKLNKNKFIRLFNRTSGILVLASNFKNDLLSWGITKPVFLTTTNVNDRLVSDFDVNTHRKGKLETLLFLAWVEIEKGIIIAIDTYKILKEKYPFLKMRIVGSGGALDKAKAKAEDYDLKDVVFTGNLSGMELIPHFTQSDLYLFPTYGEGMPITVLEAMAFGLPVITRPVGGLVDFFENGKMGLMLDSLNPCDFADAIEKYIVDKNLTKETSLYNYAYAKSNFMASQVAKNMENLFGRILIYN